MSKGGRKLIILGIASVAITLLTCGISLAIYHMSGDIYLDRSRPGFLPEEEEEELPEKNTYVFSDDGPITKEVIDEYIKNLTEKVNELDSSVEPFSASPLSDEALGIPEK